MLHWTPSIVLAAILALLPLLAAAFCSRRIADCAAAAPTSATLLAPALLCVPYLLTSTSAGIFRTKWLLLYALLPVASAALLRRARAIDPARLGTGCDYAVLAILGSAVDLRWFEPAWPAHLAVLNKILLLDMGIYGFLAVRRLDGIGLSLRLRRRDLLTGIWELVLFLPIALPLGIGLDFLHPHRQWPLPSRAASAWIFTFLFIALPEEIFFRGWLQNLLERRFGRLRALLLTALLFGLAHFNKRTQSFNWRYVLLAAIAGIFYGRAWRTDRRIAAAAITHASVDTLWSLFLR